MNQPGRVPAVVANLILVFSLAILWVAFAPTRLGGNVAYVIVNGISMEPDYHLGDLTVMRRAGAYQIGDVVTYRDAKMQAYVIHRIIGIEQDHYVLKGDNNSWIDAYRPTHEEIVGKLWIHFPGVGTWFKWLRAPLHLALTVGLLGGILVASMIKPSPSRKSTSAPMSPVRGGTWEIGLYVFGFLALTCLGLSILSFLRPLTRAASQIQYQQESRFSYSATGTPVIYDTETVRSGEPVFPRLTCFLNIAFTYSVTGDQLQNISGSYELIARVVEEQSGWQRTIPMSPAGAFTGNSFSAASNLDLCEIVSLVNTLKEETGLRASNFTLEVIPQISLIADAMGNPINDSFEPRLVFRFDDVHFSLSVPKGQDDPLYSLKQGSAENSSQVPNTLSLLSWQFRVGTLRVVSLLGLALSLSGLLAAAFHVFKLAQQSQEALIHLKYGSLLVNVYERNLAPASMLIDVTTIDELAKLAERHNTVILHMTLNFLHYYLVQCNGMTYRYVFSAGRRGIPEIEPPRQPVINYVTNVSEHRRVEVELNEDALFSYVLEKRNRRTPRADGTDTVILKKIRL
jgi:signal peptidase I